MAQSGSPSESSAPSSQPTDSWRRRLLMEGEEGVSEDVPLERRLQIIERMKNRGAKPDATFSSVYDLISPKSCDVLIKYMDETLAHALDDEENIPAGDETSTSEGLHEMWNSFAQGGVANQFNKKLYANDLVRLIGREETLKIIDFFEESLGDLTIDCLYLARHGWNGKDPFLVPWHNDDYATMEITLNDNYEGGHVLHMNADGVHKTDARPGSATGKTSLFYRSFSIGFSNLASLNVYCILSSSHCRYCSWYHSKHWRCQVYAHCKASLQSS